MRTAMQRLLDLVPGVRLSLLALQLVLSAFPGADLAICIAADGHTAVEVAHAARGCRTEVERHHPGAGATYDLGQHPCVDIVLAQPSLRSAPGADVLALCGAALPFVGLATAPGRGGPQGLPPSRLDGSVPAGRTTVLIV
jgi:hypothetical protein